MHNYKRALLSTLSVVSFLTAITVSQAFAESPVNLGVLTPSGDWRVGTVNPVEAEPYCAMMNHFSGGSVLAFSKNAESQGSVAMDFRDHIFKFGMSYRVSLQVDDKAVYTLMGRASSERSLVVQLGNNNSFYNALNKDGHLSVKLSPMQAKFSLRKFSTSYASLVDCVLGLRQGPKTEAVPVANVEKALLPTKLVSLDDTKEKIVAMDEEVSRLRQGLKEKEIARQREEENSRDIRKLREESSDKLALLGKKQKTLMKQLQEKKKKISILEDQDQESKWRLVKRKKASLLNEEQKTLIQQLEEQKKKVALLEKKRIDQEEAQKKLQNAVQNKNSEIAKMESDWRSRDLHQVNKVSAEERELLQRKEYLEKERDALRSRVNMAQKSVQEGQMAVAMSQSLKENLLKKEKELESQLWRQKEKSARLAGELASAKSLYEARLAAVKAERYVLAKKIEKMATQNSSMQGVSNFNDKRSLIEEQMKRVSEEKEILQDRLKAQEMQNKVLRAALNAKEETIQDTTQLASLHEELQNAKKRHALSIKVLREELAEKTEQYKKLEDRFDVYSSMPPVGPKDAKKLEEQSAYVLELEKHLETVERKRKAAEWAAKKAEAELAEKQLFLERQARLKIQNSKDLETGLLATQLDYRADLEVARRERNELQKKLDDIKSGKISIDQDVAKSKEELKAAQEKMSSLEIRLAIAAQQKQELTDTLAAQLKRNKVLQAALSAKEKELSSGDQEKLKMVQEELAAVKLRHTLQAKKTKEELDKKTAQYKDLEKQFDIYSSAPLSGQGVAEELAEKVKEVASLENKLLETERQREEAIKTAEKAEEKLFEQKMKLSELTKKKVQQSKMLAANLAAGETDFKAKLLSAQKELSGFKKKLEEEVARNAPLKQEKERALSDLASAEARLKDFENKLKEAAKQKEMLEARLSVEEKKTSAMQESLDAKGKSTMLAEGQGFRTVQDELASKVKQYEILKEKLEEVEAKRKAAEDDAKRVQNQLADLKSIQGGKAANMLQKLSEAQAERDALKERLASLEKDKKPLLLTKTEAEKKLAETREKLVLLEARFAALDEQKDELVEQLDLQNKNSKKLQETLAEREKEILSRKIASKRDGKKLLAAEDELKKIKPEYASVVTDLVAQLKNKVKQYDGLQNRFDKQARLLPKARRMAEELATRRADVTRLESQLAEVNTQYKSAIEEAERSQNNFERSHRLLSDLKEDLAGDRERLSKLEGILKEQQGDLEQRATQQALEMERLKMEGEKLVAMRKELAVKDARNTKIMRERLAKISSMGSADNEKVRAIEEDLIKQQASLEEQAAELEAKRIKLSGFYEAETDNVRMASVDKNKLEDSKYRVKNLKRRMERTKNRIEEIESGLERNKNLVDKRKKALEEKSEEIVWKPSDNTLEASKKVALLEGAGSELLEDFIAEDAAVTAERERIFKSDEVVKAKKTLGRAEKFLNKIMAYHRPTESAAPGERVMQPGILDGFSDVLPSKKKGFGTETLGSAAAHSSLSDVLRQEVVPSGQKLTLEALLNESGLEVESFSPVESADGGLITQWMSGKVSGMYEKEPVKDTFDGQIDSYIRRYRQDCGEGLEVRQSAAEFGQIGTIAVADIECHMDMNQYVTSFVFLRDHAGFNVFLHSSYPKDREKVKYVRDSMAHQLRKSSGFEVPQTIQKSADVALPLKLNIPVEEVRGLKDETPSLTLDNLETLVIQ